MRTLPAALCAAALALLPLTACSPKPLTAEEYAAGWSGVMKEFERTTASLPEPALEEGWTVEQKRAAVADALTAAGKEIERVSKMQDALRPPKESAKLHEMTSKYFHDEVGLFADYAKAARAGESTDPVRDRFRAHHETIQDIYAEAFRLGFEAAAPTIAE